MSELIVKNLIVLAQKFQASFIMGEGANIGNSILEERTELHFGFTVENTAKLAQNCNPIFNCQFHHREEGERAKLEIQSTETKFKSYDRKLARNYQYREGG